MASTPKKRDRVEQAQNTGQLSNGTSPKRDASKRGASPEFMREMTRKRMEKAKTDPNAKGGRPRTKFKRAEAEENALLKLVPKALKVLEEQLDDPDERVRQSAAVKVLEWGKGKPSQSVKIDGDQTHTIRYETVVLVPDLIEALPSAEETYLELNPGEPPQLPEEIEEAEFVESGS